MTPQPKNENRNFVKDIPDHVKDPITSRDESAMFHAIKSLGEYYPVAKKFFDNNSIRLREEAREQLHALEAKGIATRNEDGFVITGLLDLTKFGLTPEQAKHQNEFLAQERAAGGYATPQREAMLHAVKELGPDHLHEAIDAIGLEEITKRARKQLDAIPPEFTKKDGLIVVGLLDVKDLGLNSEQAEARTAQIEEMRLNPQRYLTTSVSPFFQQSAQERNETILKKYVPSFDAPKFATLNKETYEAELSEVVAQVAGQLRENRPVESSKLLAFGLDEKEIQALTATLTNKTPNTFVKDTTPISQGVASVATPVDVVGDYTKKQSEKGADAGQEVWKL